MKVETKAVGQDLKTIGERLEKELGMNAQISSFVLPSKKHGTHATRLNMKCLPNAFAEHIAIMDNLLSLCATKVSSPVSIRDNRCKDAREIFCNLKKGAIPFVTSCAKNPHERLRETI